MNTKSDATRAFKLLKKWMPSSELSTMASACYSEEKQFFFDKAVEIEQRILNMPETYGQDGLGDKAIVYLHYFKGSFDWWITEKDSDPEQNQAFGFADMGEPELGYISIPELVANGVELDLYFTPKTLEAVKFEHHYERQFNDA